MKRYVLVLLQVVLVTFFAQAQKQGNYWYFGNNAGLNFNTDPPTILTNGMLSTTEGCATISDADGNLLFYTDGIKVYNKNHGTMPNGTGLLGDPSSAQSGIIVPYPGKPSQYFIFTVSAYSNSSLYYSIVDMSLNGGLGDVLTPKNVPVLATTEESVCAVFANNFYWIITHKRGSNQYYAYKLTNAGLDLANPVITSVGYTTPSNGDIGYLKSDITGTKLAMTYYFAGKTEVLSFNKVTGVVSTPIALTVASSYGVEFSPNGKVLYVHGFGAGTYQFNLEAGTQTQIQSSQFTLRTGASEGALQIAVNGKIYVANFGATSLSVINNPNVLGTGCNYVIGGQSLGSKTSAIGLPTIMTSFVSTGPPIVSGPAATNISNTSATIEAIVNGDGGSAITERGFYYGTTANPTTNKTTVTGTTGNFNTGISGLTPNTLYYFRAYATNANGTTYTVDETFTTAAAPAGPAITAGFTVNTANQCFSGHSYTFTNTSSITSGTLSYSWDFGDGNTATTTSPSHTYSAPGTYTVTLTATEDEGEATETSTQTVIVYASPVASFTTGTAGSQCLTGNSYSFTNTSSISSGTLTYSWDFGDGSTATSQDATHSYTAAGTYTVKLTATSGNNCANSTTTTVTVYAQPVATFTINNASQCFTGNSYSFTNTSSISSGTLTYSWDFGDGGTATSQDATHSYTAAGTYTVKLTATSGNNCVNSTTKTVTVYPQPTAAFTIGSTTQCFTGNSFSFTNTSSISSGTLTYSWDFGDGSTATSQDATHSYTAAGTYTVKLTATSANNCVHSTTATVTVYPKPTVAFTINTAEQCLTNNKFTFSNTSAISSGSITYAWNFGDGSTLTSQNPEHQYSAPGTYKVKLVVTSNNNCKDSLEKTVTVYSLPTGTLTTPNGLTICDGTTTTLQATGGNTYQWYLDDVAINNATGSTYAATTGGVYTVKLFNEQGCTNMATGSATMTLIRQPAVNFSFDKYCIGQPTTFNNQSTTTQSGAVTYNWTLGNNTTSTDKNPVVSYTQVATYAVKLEVVPTLCPALKQSVTKNVNTEAPRAATRYAIVDAVIGKDVTLQARDFNATIQWTPADNLSDAHRYNPVLKPAKQQEYRIRYDFASGCVTVDSLLVRVFNGESIFVPKAFTPNGDGKNDVLRPSLVGIRELTYFRVYNRWGNLLFETRTMGQGWDGNYKGMLQPMETYIWVAEGITDKGTKVRETGNTTLIR